MVLGAAQRLGVLAQQHCLIDGMSMLSCNGHDVVYPGSGMQLVAEGGITSNAGHKGLDRRNGHN